MADDIVESLKTMARARWSLQISAGEARQSDLENDVCWKAAAEITRLRSLTFCPEDDRALDEACETIEATRQQALDYYRRQGDWLEMIRRARKKLSASPSPPIVPSLSPVGGLVETDRYARLREWLPQYAKDFRARGMDNSADIIDEAATALIVLEAELEKCKRSKMTPEQARIMWEGPT